MTQMLNAIHLRQLRSKLFFMLYKYYSNHCYFNIKYNSSSKLSIFIKSSQNSDGRCCWISTVLIKYISKSEPPFYHFSNFSNAPPTAVVDGWPYTRYRPVYYSLLLTDNLDLHIELVCRTIFPLLLAPKGLVQASSSRSVMATDKVH